MWTLIVAFGGRAYPAYKHWDAIKGRLRRGRTFQKQMAYTFESRISGLGNDRYLRQRRAMA